MEEKIKKNINIYLSIFLLCQPILDLLTGFSLHTLKINLTIGIIVRVFFLMMMIICSIFIFKKKKLLIPYSIIFLYIIFYIVGIFLYKDGGNLFSEIQGVIKVFYFPSLLLALYSMKEEIRISKLTYLTTLFLYLIFIFVPTIFGFGYKTYEITKAGTLGFFNSANEISGIISILTPYLLIILVTTKRLYPKIGFSLMYLVIILMVGTKTPLLVLLVTLGMSFIYYWILKIKQKEYKKVGISFGVLILGISSIIIILPKTNFYKNIKTHLDFLEVENIHEIFEKEELIDHFIFSQRLTFLKNKREIYNQSNTYQKFFGIGYINNNKTTKLIEMDYFDIYYSHGIIGFILFFTIFIVILLKLWKKEKFTYETFMRKTSILWILFLSFFTGHIITSPSVSFLGVLLLFSISPSIKKVVIGKIKIENMDRIDDSKLEKLKKKSYYLLFKIINFKNYSCCILYNKKDHFSKEIGELLSDKVIQVSTKKELLELGEKSC